MRGGSAANPKEKWNEKRFLGILPAAGLGIALVLGLAFSWSPNPPPRSEAAAPTPALKQGTPACMAAAREILTMKNAAAMYANAVPNIVRQDHGPVLLLDQASSYQKDLSEVAVIVAQTLAGREKEIGEGMAQIYCNEFSEERSWSTSSPSTSRRSARNCLRANPAQSSSACPR